MNKDGERVVAMLHALENMVDENKERNGINQLQHSLRTAALVKIRKKSNLGSLPFQLAVSLTHDIGKVVSDVNHPAVGAEIVRPYLGDVGADIISAHGIFQHDLLFGTCDSTKFSGKNWYRFAQELAFCEGQSFRWDEIKEKNLPNLLPSEPTLQEFIPYLERFWE